MVAPNYSLVCWGGRTGRVVSISASTDLVTFTNHGVKNGLKLWPSGTLPAELSAATPVYARYVSSTTFTLHTSAAGAIANTGQILFAGASTYSSVTLKSDFVAGSALTAYGVSISRYGTSGSEKIYDGLYSWYNARYSANTEFAEEWCEIGEVFDDITGNQMDLVFKAPKVLLTTKINGIYSDGFHKGVFGAGFSHTYYGYGFVTRTPGITIEGFTIRQRGGVSTRNIELIAFNSLAQQMFLVGVSRYAGSEGIRFSGVGTTARNCVAVGFNRGFAFTSYSSYESAYNCLATDNTIGFGDPYDSGSSIYGTVINCISVGNATNWFAQGTQMVSADKNAGLTGEAWLTGSNTRIAVDANWNSTTPLFKDYANKDFRPYTPLNANSTLLTEAGRDYYNPLGYDIANNVAPAYMNGAAAYLDVGPFEYDPGYGPWPVTATLTLTGLVSGSDVVVLAAGTSTILTSVDANAGSSWGYTYSTIQNVDIGIIKPGYKVKYIRNYPLSASDTSIPVEQQADLSYA